MPEIDNIVVADATPTNHTFSPLQASVALSSWMAREAASYEGNPRLAVAISQPSKTRSTTREKLTFTLPFERNVNGVIMVPDTITYYTEAVIPVGCSDAEALKAYTMFKNLWANSQIQSVFASRNTLW